MNFTHDLGDRSKFPFWMTRPILPHSKKIDGPDFDKIPPHASQCVHHIAPTSLRTRAHFTRLVGYVSLEAYASQVPPPPQWDGTLARNDRVGVQAGGP